MTISNKTLFVLAAICSAATVPAHAQQGAPEDPTIKDTANKVTEPFDGKEIPPKLLEIQEAPYSLAGLGRCAAIIREVEELDVVLGADVNEQVDKSRGEKREETAGRVVGTIAGSVIPFRGLIGEITGANAERRRYALAVYAGTVRRGFLKGVGLERGCRAPARP
jgi:predicted AAA+ superfamily ATPase